ncbi:alpha/beta hydrolase [Maricaulis maris]|uniref:Phospholipase/carboxylesterase n=1 Tax=Maricaulis maris TaxID=74318 RepID=A0A495CZS0_9PROT|nr:phospholipase [Maricaulis maris]RKQ94250.1 phospholipase/carboxylesterase [Maricaulis maris]
MTRPIDGPRLAPRDGSTPKKLVIFLHGYGSNGKDLIGLGQHWARDLPHVQWVSPNAPDPVPGAPDGYQWFPISNLDPQRIEAGAATAWPIVDAFIDQELTRYGLTESDLVLCGFSQGTMLSLATGLRRERPIAGIMGFSGALPGGERLKEEVRSKPPIMLVHGDQDQVLPLGFMFDALENLAAAGHGAQWHISQGLPHSIGEDGLDIGKRFIGNALAGRYR